MTIVKTMKLLLGSIGSGSRKGVLAAPFSDMKNFFITGCCIWVFLPVLLLSFPALASEGDGFIPALSEEGEDFIPYLSENEEEFVPNGGLRKVIADARKAFTDPDSYDLYVPFWTWHNRYMYDKHKTDRYNELPWGGGLGVSRMDDNGNEDSLYFMVFKDSNYHLQTAFGYAWQKIWRSEDNNWRLGAGLTLAVLQRQEYHYLPLPVPLPIVGISYKRVSVQATYIPGTYNYGNVLFMWLRINVWEG